MKKLRLSTKFPQQEITLIRNFASEKGIIALVIDNCLAHSHIENLKSIKLFFLPPNTTSTNQPMDQDVIRSLKAKYRKNINSSKDHQKFREKQSSTDNVHLK